MSLEVPIIEIFASLQGEGPYVGERHLFIRFQDCELSCKFCDTPLTFVSNRFCRMEYPPFSKRFRNIPNPISAEQLTPLLADFEEKTLSLTGGEPLQKAAFLKEWLPQIKPRFRILLETAGVHVNELKEIISLVDIISMDIKLSSSTGMHPWWREHESFLKMAQENHKEVYVKVVVTSETTDENILKAVHLMSSMDPTIPFILQPATAFGRFKAVPSMDQVASWQAMVQKTLPGVRVIPQMHKQLGIL